MSPRRSRRSRRRRSAKRWRDFATTSGLRDRTSARVALYADRDVRIRRNTPHVFATQSDDAAGQWLVVMESIDDAARRRSGLVDEAIDAAIIGLAQIHAAGIERRDELATARGKRPCATSGNGARCSRSGPRSRRTRSIIRRRGPIAGCDGHMSVWSSKSPAWARALDDSPRSLIHNDFNPRNIALRRDAEGSRSAHSIGSSRRWALRSATSPSCWHSCFRRTRRARRLRGAWSNTASCYNVRQASISIAANGNEASARRCAN